MTDAVSAQPIGGLDFVPQPPEGLSGPAFPVVVKVVAGLFGLGAAWGMARNGLVFNDTPVPNLTSGLSFWYWAALVIVWWMLVYIWMGRTTLTATRMTQRWIWRKEVDFAHLAHVRILRVRGLEWLVAPRVYAHTHDRRFTLFYVADAAVLLQCERLRDALAKQNARQ